MGQEMADELMPIAGTEETVAREGSIIIVVATDAPLLPHQLTRLVSTTPSSLFVGLLEKTTPPFAAITTLRPTEKTRSSQPFRAFSDRV